MRQDDCLECLECHSGQQCNADDNDLIGWKGLLDLDLDLPLGQQILAASREESDPTRLKSGNLIGQKTITIGT